MTAMTSKQFRSETDLLGEMQIDQANYFGIQTQRAINNFQLSSQTLNDFPELIHALAYVKSACAQANNQQHKLDDTKTNVIVNACQKIINNQFNSSFPIDMIQGGAGTSSNMNINEVIANIALQGLGYQKGQYQFIHPNSHVNMSQSTNDVYPTAVRLAILLKQPLLLSNLKNLTHTFTQKDDEFKNIIKLARTQLQDAVPMTLGQEFSGFAATLIEDHKLITSMGKLLTEINLGGTAVGTGINTQIGYGRLAVD